MGLIVAGVIFITYHLKIDALMAYIKGLEELKSGYFSQKQYFNYLMGEFSLETFPHYHLIAFLIKTPVPIFILLAMAFTLNRQ
jgi:hypothetical protein